MERRLVTPEQLAQQHHRHNLIPLVQEFGTTGPEGWQRSIVGLATHVRVTVYVCPDCSETFDIGIAHAPEADSGR